MFVQRIVYRWKFDCVKAANLKIQAFAFNDKWAISTNEKHLLKLIDFFLPNNIHSSIETLWNADIAREAPKTIQKLIKQTWTCFLSNISHISPHFFKENSSWMQRFLWISVTFIDVCVQTIAHNKQPSKLHWKKYFLMLFTHQHFITVQLPVHAFLCKFLEKAFKFVSKQSFRKCKHWIINLVCLSSFWI